MQTSAWGDGPVDASYRAIEEAAKSAASVEEYAIHAVTGGREAMGEVTVQVTEGERTAKGRGVSTDVIEASAKAYVYALNRLAIRVNGGGDQPEGV